MSTESKLETPIDHSAEGVVVHGRCSRLVLQRRFHDRQRGWSDWETIDGRALIQNYGTTPDDWKRCCAQWIEMGGRYEYAIMRVTETLEWSACFTENARSADTARK
jgi:hypothetical protein